MVANLMGDRSMMVTNDVLQNRFQCSLCRVSPCLEARCYQMPVG